MENTGKSQYTIPVVMFSGKILCYECYQNCETDRLHYWLPEDAANYPIDCEECGLTCLGPKE